MGFPESILDSDERVVRSLRPHWRRIALAVSLLPIVVGLGSYGITKESDHEVVVDAILVAGVAILVWFSLRPILVWLSTRYVVTDRRVLIRTGVLSRNGRDIPMTRINDVSFQRTIVERIFGSGTLTIESAGERGQIQLKDVPHVEPAQREIYRLVEAEAQRLR